MQVVCISFSCHRRLASTRHPPSTLNPQPPLNPKPQTPNPKQALSTVIGDFSSPDMLTAADLSRNLDARLKPIISYLVACRPMSIAMGNAIRWLKSKIAHLPSTLSVIEGKEYLRDQV